VTDDDGLSDTTAKLVEVGNTPPVIDIKVASLNRFIWSDEPASSYQVIITDVEDGLVTEDSEYFKNVNISYSKVDESTQEEKLGHQVSGPLVLGRAASKKHLCIGCHQEQSASVGPAFNLIADKYVSKTDAVDYLKQSIAAGGSGRWGQHNMPAHDFLSDDVRTVLSSYILALKSAPPSLPMAGELPKIQETGTFQLKASYQDQGAQGLSRIQNQQVVNMRSPQIVASSLVHHEGQANGVRTREAIGLSTVAMYGHNTNLYLGEYDLSEVKSLVLSQLYWWRLHNDVTVEIRVGSTSGEVIATGKFDYKGVKQDEEVELVLDVSATKIKEKLYLVTILPNAESEPLTLHLRDITFANE
jgi:cytochrome c